MKKRTVCKSLPLNLIWLLVYLFLLYIFSVTAKENMETINAREDKGKNVHVNREDNTATKSSDIQTLSNHHMGLIIDPINPMLLFRRGLKYKELGIYQLAIYDMTVALAIKPDFTTALYQLGRVYMDCEKYGIAKSLLERVVRLYHNDARTLTTSLLTLQQEIEDVLLAFEAKRLLCQCYLHERDYQKAVDMCKEAYEYELDAQLLCFRGDAFLGLQWFDESISEYKSALKIDTRLECGVRGVEKALLLRLNYQMEQRVLRPLRLSTESRYDDDVNKFAQEEFLKMFQELLSDDQDNKPYNDGDSNKSERNHTKIMREDWYQLEEF